MTLIDSESLLITDVQWAQRVACEMAPHTIVQTCDQQPQRCRHLLLNACIMTKLFDSFEVRESDIPSCDSTLNDIAMQLLSSVTTIKEWKTQMNELPNFGKESGNSKGSYLHTSLFFSTRSSRSARLSKYLKLFFSDPCDDCCHCDRHCGCRCDACCCCSCCWAAAAGAWDAAVAAQPTVLIAAAQVTVMIVAAHSIEMIVAAQPTLMIVTWVFVQFNQSLV